MSGAPGIGPGPGPGPGPAVEARLTAFLAAQLPGAHDLRVTGLTRTSSGYSRENWPFDAHWRTDDGVESAELIMRRDPAGSVLVTDRREEFAVLRALEGSDVPAPRARWLDATGEWLERPSVVMDRVAGVCDWFVMNGDRPLEERIDFAHRYLALLASIHRFDWRASGLGARLADPGDAGALAAIDHWEAELRREQLEPYPELEVVVGWLRAHAPVAPATVLVHGDFKPGNLLLDPTGSTDVVAVLDWETAHLGDPIEDVGWMTNPLRHREHQIPGVWEREQIAARYEEITGYAVTDDALRFWNVLANFKLAVIVVTGVRSFVEGRGDRVFTGPSALVGLMYDLMAV